MKSTISTWVCSIASIPSFVIAGTDVLASDPLGGLRLSVEDVVHRDRMIFEKLQNLSIPAVFLGGGGYSADNVNAITESLSNLSNQMAEGPH